MNIQINAQIEGCTNDTPYIEQVKIYLDDDAMMVIANTLVSLGIHGSLEIDQQDAQPTSVQLPVFSDYRGGVSPSTMLHVTSHIQHTTCTNKRYYATQI